MQGKIGILQAAQSAAQISPTDGPVQWNQQPLQEVIQPVRKRLFAFEFLLNLDVGEGGEREVYESTCGGACQGHPARMLFAIELKKSSNKNCRSVPQDDL